MHILLNRYLINKLKKYAFIPNEKQANNLNKHSSSKIHKWSVIQEKILNIINRQGNTSQNYEVYHFTTSRMVKDIEKQGHPRLLMGEGNGTPLQYSCLENPMDGGAWWAAVYGVKQSWTRLKRRSSSSNPPKPRVMCSGHPEALCDMNTCHLCCRVQGHWSHPPAQGRTSHLSSHRRSLSSWQRPSEAALHG